jgi:hypothetical protein
MHIGVSENGHLASFVLKKRYLLSISILFEIKKKIINQK